MRKHSAMNRCLTPPAPERRAVIRAHSEAGYIDTKAALGTRTVHQQADQNVQASNVRSRS
jgi:hypothetical protein